MGNRQLRGMIGLVRLGAVAAIIGGGLRIGFALIFYDPASAAQELLFGIIDVGLLFGLIAVYLSVADRTGKAGLAAFTIALAALASFVGPDAQRFGVDFYWAGASLFLIALAAFALLLLRQRLLVPTASLWLLSLVLGLAAMAARPLALAASGLALGLSFVAAGIAILRPAFAPALR